MCTFISGPPYVEVEESPQVDRDRADGIQQRAHARALRSDILRWLLLLDVNAVHEYAGATFDFLHGELVIRTAPEPFAQVVGVPLSLKEAVAILAPMRERELAREAGAQ